MTVFDPIERPEGYNQGSIEVWDFIIDQNMNYLEGNVIKYVCRYKQKSGVDDLRKAARYLDKLIETFETADASRD